MLYIVSNISAQASTSDANTPSTTVTVSITDATSQSTPAVNDADETLETVTAIDDTATGSVTGYNADGEVVTGTVITQEAVDDNGNIIEDTAESELGKFQETKQ